MDNVPTEEEIFRIGMDNVVVNTCLQAYRCGKITFQEALLFCVRMLAERNKSLFQALCDSKENEASANLMTIAELNDGHIGMHLLHNTVRDIVGLHRLNYNLVAEQLAKSHAEAIAKSGIISHDDAGDGCFKDRMNDAGLEGVVSAGENIAIGDSAVEIFKRWMQKKGKHRDNVLGGYHEMGVACRKSGPRTIWVVTYFNKGSQ